MPAAIVVIDHSKIQPGRLDELRTAMRGLAEFVEANEPRIAAYGVHFSGDGGRMTVFQAHPDPDSAVFHMDVAGPMFRGLTGMLELLEIHVYGEPGAELLARLRAKATLLGNATIEVHERHAGFARWT